MKYKDKKFVASYSGGKDSTLAIYRAINKEMIPMELITTYNIDKNRSWFHGILEESLQAASKAMNIPLNLIKTTGKDYAFNFEQKLRKAKENGADICVFGDIDMEDHFQWCTEICKNAGIEAHFPLWKEDRKKLVYEFIDEGFKTIINVVDNSRMPKDFVGEVLTRELANKIEKSGADICGENGEYHSFAFDGPIFTNPVDFTRGTIIQVDNFTVMPIIP